MTTTPDLAAPAPDSPARRRWLTWGAVLVLLALILVVAVLPGMRALAADTWREMRSIPPGYLTLIVALKVGQSLFTALTWRNALLAAWPRSPLAYRFVLGVEQGQVTLNTIAPARAGTWAMLGIFKMSIRGARAPKLLAVWAAQNLAFGFFAACTYVLVAIGLPDQADAGGGPVDRGMTAIAARPLLVAGVVLALGLGLTLVVVKGRRRLAGAWLEVREGLAILRPPVRYLRLLFLPSLISYAFNCAACAVLLAAFGIPVTIWTVALALGSNALAGAVRITPGGLGTTQAIDVIALRAYAPPEVVTAYSLSELAVTAVASAVLATAALLSVSGWHGTRRLLLHRHDFATGLHTLGDRQRALRARATRRKAPGSGR